MRTKTGDLPTTLAELRNFLHIDGTDDDEQLQRCLETGIDYVEKETERDIIVSSVEEYVDPSMIAGTCVTLRRSPALSLESIEIDGVAVTEGFEFRPNSHRRSRIKFKALAPGSVLVRYTTGMPDDPTAKQACLWAAAHFYENREPETEKPVNTYTTGLRRILKLLGANRYA